MKLTKMVGMVVTGFALAGMVTGCGGAEEGEEIAATEGGGGSAPASFVAVFESNGMVSCGNCHAPDAPGNVTGTEKTQDWSDLEAAYASLQQTATGLTGNFEGCNGVPFIGDTVETSLIVATFDEDIRANFSHPDFPDCTGEAISDMVLKTGGSFNDEDLALLKAWVAEEIAN